MQTYEYCSNADRVIKEQQNSFADITKYLAKNEEKIALSLALEVMECEREKYRFWAYSELNDENNWERMTYEDAIKIIKKMIDDNH